MRADAGHRGHQRFAVSCDDCTGGTMVVRQHPGKRAPHFSRRARGLTSRQLVRATDDARIQIAEALLIVLGNLLDIIRTAEVALTPSELQLLTRVVR